MNRPEIRLLLSHPTHSGNIGAVARAMKNMGLESLHLVAPEADHRSEQARARAAGAEDLLFAARVWPDLVSALAGSRLVIGTSARPREIAWPVLSPEAAARELVEAARSGPVALLFGQERMGLTNKELEHCHSLVSIPTDPAFPSLNLGAAVQIMAYEILLAGSDDAASRPESPAREPLATHEEMSRLYRHLEEVLGEIGFFGARHPEKLMRRMVRLFNRARPDESEVSILRGILTAVQQSLRSAPDRMTRS